MENAEFPKNFCVEENIPARTGNAKFSKSFLLLRKILMRKLVMPNFHDFLENISEGIDDAEFSKNFFKENIPARMDYADLSKKFPVEEDIEKRMANPNFPRIFLLKKIFPRGWTVPNFSITRDFARPQPNDKKLEFSQ